VNCIDVAVPPHNAAQKSASPIDWNVIGCVCCDIQVSLSENWREVSFVDNLFDYL
jgi:hypothetical protein